MVVFHSIFSIWHGPSLSYLHGKKLKKQEEIDAGSNNECAGLNSENIMNSVNTLNASFAINDNLGGWTIFPTKIPGMNNNSCT